MKRNKGIFHFVTKWEETWADIKGYEGLYQVSNWGRVKSLDRKVTRKNGVENKYKSKILKPFEHKHSPNSNLFVNLSKNGKVRKHFVYRLVAEAFVSNPFNYNEIMHKDFDVTNNRASNLEWCGHRWYSEQTLEKMRKQKKSWRKTNTGEKYIRKVGNRYSVSLVTTRTFESLDEAIAYRDEAVRQKERV